MSYALRPLFAALLLSVPACAPQNDLDLEDFGSDDEALEASRIVFSGDWSESVQGKLRAGDAIEIAYDPSRLSGCRGEQGGIPQWSITAFYRVGEGELHTVTVAGLNAEAKPVLVPEGKGKLSLWFEVTNVWGCHAYDSDFGKNYRFDVSSAVGQPGWVGNGAFVISRWTCDNGNACDSSRVGFENGFVFDTWARQRATIAGLFFDVWEEGVTDWDNADLWKQVDVQIHYRYSGQQAFSTRYVDFSKRVGNDARYEQKLRFLDPFHAMPSVVAEDQCPAADLTLTAGGQYVSTELEYYFTADGVELRPEGGGTYHGRFEDYAQPYTACL
jgi:hypothetical protein